jgi:hypothetical protein
MLRSTTHKASLVDSSLHSPAMLDLLELKVDRLLIGAFLRHRLFCVVTVFSSQLVEHIVQSTIDTVSFAMNGASTSFSSRGRATSSSNNHGLFTIFASDTIRRSQATIPILLVTLVYIKRSGCHLLIQSEKWACERVFLGALILAAKVCSKCRALIVISILIRFIRSVPQRCITQECSLGNMHRHFWQA